MGALHDERLRDRGCGAGLRGRDGRAQAGALTHNGPVTNFARTERAALAELLDRTGPDAPTLCEGWATRDLAAHLVLRERRPDAAAGIVLGPLAGHTDAVQADYAARPWPELVDLVRQGPPRWSPSVLAPVDRGANTIEFFVHHEDVRRARPAWAPRPADPALERELWRMLSVRARMMFARSRVGVVLRRDTGEEAVASGGEPPVTLVGPASELVLYAHGRRQHARVTVEGDPEAVRVFATTPLGV
jgi:uncharacterized protein (TIGR03085 family)